MSVSALQVRERERKGERERERERKGERHWEGIKRRKKEQGIIYNHDCTRVEG